MAKIAALSGVEPNFGGDGIRAGVIKVIKADKVYVRLLRVKD